MIKPWDPFLRDVALYLFPVPFETFHFICHRKTKTSQFDGGISYVTCRRVQPQEKRELPKDLATSFRESTL
ncbi:Hypothetical protein NTJ_12242 [Nesidiocoris tenuis]|uniref:Uncharacterized protein n=1 Tax=Nesidiocoris tenuis TaxID=355587 RepID=A0ABN7B4T1_9HEMI|nr:Hypothetical protein NTJ_12242 [Nesidiocoris tenuis]